MAYYVHAYLDGERRVRSARGSPVFNDCVGPVSDDVDDLDRAEQGLYESQMPGVAERDRRGHRGTAVPALIAKVEDLGATAVEDGDEAKEDSRAGVRR